MYEINIVKVHEAEAAYLVQSLTEDNTVKLWHRCLGHLNMKGVYTLQNMVSGMNLGKKICPTSSLFCEACIKDKQHRVVVPNEGGMRVARPLEIFHSYVCGPMRITSIGYAMYFVNFIDNFFKKCVFVCVEIQK